MSSHALSFCDSQLELKISTESYRLRFGDMTRRVKRERRVHAGGAGGAVDEAAWGAAAAGTASTGAAEPITER